jgi:CMP-N-acetylneuraminic acid synthetase
MKLGEVMKRIAVIPARSGSKGLCDKNIIDLCGEPLMAYSIKAALKTNLFDAVIVSTDSKKYGKIAKSFGAEVMYRDQKLSNDLASTYMVLEDFLNRIELGIDYFVLLQPTSPMRNDTHINEAVHLFDDHISDYDFLVSVKEAEHVQSLVKPIGEDGSLKYFNENYADYRRQAHVEYSPNGAIFMGKPKEYLQQKHFFGPRSLAYKMSKLDSIDIDDEIDYELACLCMQKRLELCCK